MGRKENVELRKVVAHLYALGYSPSMMIDKVAEATGRRYSPGYVRKILWTMRREGLLEKPPADSAWLDALDCVKAAKLRVLAAMDDIRLGLHDRALKELDPIPQLLDRAMADIAALRRLFSGVRVVK